MLRLRRSLVLGLAAFVACERPSVAPLVEPATARARLEVARDTAPGRVLAVALTVRGDGMPLMALQGWVTFNPDRLRWLGQVPDSATVTLINDAAADAGRLRLAALHGDVLPSRVVVLAFEVLRGGDPALAFAPEAAARADLSPVAVRPEPATLADLGPPAGARRMSADDWADVVAPGWRDAPARVPGQYRLNLVYGDATLDGAVNGLDALAVQRLAIGINPLLTDATKDYVIAANVAPANAPGLGESGDAVPPGVNPDGSLTIDVLDAAPIKREAVLIDQPVVGELIPGRGPLAGTRVIVTGIIDTGATRTFTRDTVYELQGMVNVWGRLLIEPGTRIEGDPATRGALVVRQGGRIDARGTRLEPIVMTCAAAIPAPGCWGGVTLNGVALLNNSDFPVEQFVCPVKLAPNSPGLYGGCQPTDSSGVLRYVRIEFAGAPRSGTGPVSGLGLLGVGQRTVIESVQVHASLGDGLWISGGAVDARAVVLTLNDGAGLRWSDGWSGRMQFVMIQQDSSGGPGIHGRNVVGAPGTVPASRPTLAHVTVAGPPTGAAPAAAILLDEGTNGAILNSIVQRPGAVGIDINGAETCAAAASDAVVVGFSLFHLGNPDAATDDDCLDETVWAADPTRGNRFMDPQLIAAGNLVTPDVRPLETSPARTGFTAPPVDGFFYQPSFIGAVTWATTLRTNIPWYAGWTRGR